MVSDEKGWFKGPFETQTSLQLRLSQDYQVTHFHLRGSVVYFCAVKREKLLGGEQNKKAEVKSRMCTAATYKTKDFYFGRTLDYEFSYGDEVTVTPRNYKIRSGIWEKWNPIMP